MIGDKIVRFQGDNIVIDGEVYLGTPGIWTFITDQIPKQFDQDDYERCKERLHETRVLYRNFDSTSSYPRANKSVRIFDLVVKSLSSGIQPSGVMIDK